MNHKYDNSERLETVSDKQWREALDELTTYLRWRLKGKTQRDAHSERELGMPALDYYQEEAVVKLIEGDWKWQDRFSLGKQLERIAADLITKQVQKWEREHPFLMEDGRCKRDDVIPERKPEMIEYTDDMEQYSDILDPSTGSGQVRQEELDETYDVVYGLVEDDEELTLFVSAIEHCGNFKDLPEHTGWEMKKVYRLMEKLMRRIRRSKLAEVRGKTEDSDEGKKRMRFIDKIYRFEAESKSAEENYRAFGTTREEHQKKMLEFIRKKLEAKKR